MLRDPVFLLIFALEGTFAARGGQKTLAFDPLLAAAVH